MPPVAPGAYMRTNIVLPARSHGVDGWSAYRWICPVALSGTVKTASPCASPQTPALHTSAAPHAAAVAPQLVLQLVSESRYVSQPSSGFGALLALQSPKYAPHTGSQGA